MASCPLPPGSLARGRCRGRFAPHNRRMQQPIPSASKLASGLAADPQRFCEYMMKDFFKRLRMWLFPPVGKRQAALIARRAVVPDVRQFRVCSRKPDNVNVYNLPTEPCWYIIAPWGDGRDGTMLRSSHLLLVSKISGQVLYDGSANDEG